MTNKKIAVRRFCRFCRNVFKLLSFWNSFQLFKKFKKLSSFWYHMNKQNKFSSSVWIIGYSLTLTSQELRHWNVQFPELTLAWKWNTWSLRFAKVENLLLQWVSQHIKQFCEMFFQSCKNSSDLMWVRQHNVSIRPYKTAENHVWSRTLVRMHHLLLQPFLHTFLCPQGKTQTA